MTHSGPPRTHTGAWVLVTILLLVAVLGTLIVPIYARSSPKLGSFPFFYDQGSGGQGHRAAQ